jgi:hypothetical protein
MNTPAWTRSPIVRFAATGIALLLLLFYIGRLVGPLAERRHLRSALQDLKREQKVQETLYPFFAELRNYEKLGEWESLRLPVPQPLEQSDIAVLPSLFEERSVAHGFTLGSLDVKVVDGDTFKKGLRVIMPVRGDFSQLGLLLMDLIKLPSLIELKHLYISHHFDEDEIVIEFVLGLTPSGVGGTNRGDS